MVSTSVENIDNLPLKTTPIDENDLKRWSHLDLVKDTIQRLEKADMIKPYDFIVIDEAHDPYTNQTSLKISIFMNVFNVHSNRIPVSGTVDAKQYYPGRFFNAALDKASDNNERNALLLTSKEGHRVTCVQIAGLIARRILCYVDEGSNVIKGERFGFIRFGSRVDLYLPKTTKVLVSLGDKVVGGETLVAELPVSE